MQKNNGNNGNPNWVEMLKGWRKEKAEQYAKAILSPPTATTLYKALPRPGVVLIMGHRRKGKTGLAHQAANLYHKVYGAPAVVHLPHIPEPLRKKIQKLLPDWMKVVDRVSEWPKDAVVIYDEAAQSAHARRSQSNEAIALDNLVGISGQRNQLLIFISHHSRKIDLNLVHEVDRILWKEPTFAHQMFERDELSDFTMRAFDFFQAIPRARARLKATLVMDFQRLEFKKCDNVLAPWWSDDLSRLFQDIQVGKGRN